MKIDEDRDILDISDHNLISIEFNAKQKSGLIFNKKKWVEEDFYEIGKGALKNMGMN